MPETTTLAEGVLEPQAEAIGELRLDLLDHRGAAAALTRAGQAARGFLDLDPVTQNEALLAALLEQLGAQVFACDDAVLGWAPNPDQARQALVSTTSAAPAPVRALLRFLATYRRCTSFVAATTAGAPGREALRGLGFELVGVLPRHRFQAGRHLDVEIYHATGEVARCAP